MKRFSLMGMAIVMIAAAAFAGGQSEEASDEARVGLVVSTLNNPFFVDLRDGAQEEADGAGIELLVLDSQNDAARELGNVEDLVTQGVDVILINPADSDAVGSAIRLANEAGVPVVTLDRAASSGEVVTHIASDNVAGGVMAGEFIIELLGGSGAVVELEGIPGTSAARDRGAGFNEALASSGLEVVARQAADFDRARGLEVMENILQAQTAIDAVFAHNDEMALGALRAVQASGRDIVIVGFDATDDARTAVAGGDMAATVAQQPRLIGASGVQAAVRIIAGETTEEYIPVALELITR